MTTRNSQTPEATRDQDLQQIREALRSLRYGSVHVVVQDGHVIQIDRTEKNRFRTKRNAVDCTPSAGCLSDHGRSYFCVTSVADWNDQKHTATVSRPCCAIPPRPFLSPGE